MAFLRSLRMVLAAPHPAGWRFIAFGLAALAAGLAWSAWLAWLGAAFAVACLLFFRDPERITPARPGLVVAPADGRVVAVDHAAPPEELGLGPEPRPRVGIFLSVLDVHVNRMPASGTVTRIAYRFGGFLNASDEQASARNERNALALRLPDGRELVVVQIAGQIARRIVCHAREGGQVRIGERFGIIRFGSRTDLYLPAGVGPLVAVGQTMIGGETVIAQLDPPLGGTAS
jgi:phosphatidylserine decarboxylase